MSKTQKSGLARAQLNLLLPISGKTARADVQSRSTAPVTRDAGCLAVHRERALANLQKSGLGPE